MGGARPCWQIGSTQARGLPITAGRSVWIGVLDRSCSSVVIARVAIVPIVAILVTPLALAWLVYSVVALLNSHITTRWPTAPGKILSFVPKKRATDRYSVALGLSKPQVTYTYEVFGVRYVNNHLSFGPDRDQEGHDPRPEQYSAGTPVLVSYDPKNPARSVLETGTSSTTYLHMVLALFLALSGVMMLRR
jgi:hypothetical protein